MLDCTTICYFYNKPCKEEREGNKKVSINSVAEDTNSLANDTIVRELTAAHTMNFQDNSSKGSSAGVSKYNNNDNDNKNNSNGDHDATP